MVRGSEESIAVFVVVVCLLQEMCRELVATSLKVELRR